MHGGTMPYTPNMNVPSRFPSADPLRIRILPRCADRLSQNKYYLPPELSLFMHWLWTPSFCLSPWSAVSLRRSWACHRSVFRGTASVSVSKKSSPMSLSDFLHERHAAIIQKTIPTSFVVGNSAGDADSILSALCWAYVASTVLRKSKDTLVTPILSIPRQDLQSQRPETMLLLKWAQVPMDILLDLQDVLSRASTFTGARVTLVDHNRLDPSLEVVGWTVTAIWDHHYDEGLYMDTCTQREIAFQDDHALVASTTTLVAEAWLSALPAPSPLSSDVALLLVGTILLDSVNMQPDAGKGTPRDQAALDILLERTDWRDGRLGHDNDPNLWDDEGKPRLTPLFERLQQAKFDVEFWKSLSVRDTLRLDYKQFTPSEGNTTTFGVSTVLLDWDTFVTKDSMLASVKQYMEEVKIDFLAVMCTFTAGDSDSLRRQLILCAKDGTLLESMVEYLRTLDVDNNLQLDEQPANNLNENDLQLRVFDQGKVKASRKQVAPVLIRYFETCVE